MKTGIITTDTYSDHDTGQGHPERADRVTAVIDQLKKVKSKNLIWKKPTKFDLKYLAFKNPISQTNEKVWKLIKTSVPKDISFGDATISEKHSNFFVNKGKATYEDE